MRTLCYYSKRQMENDKSKIFSCKAEIEIAVFNNQSAHDITMTLNDHAIFYEKLVENKEYALKINDYFEFKRPGYNFLKIIWNGEKECENKFMKILKLIVNDQHIPNYNVMIDPIENEYIKNLKSTDQGMKDYRKHLLYAGHQHGWYGDYGFEFIIDPELVETTDYSLIKGLGISPVKIYTDKEKMKFYRKVKQ